MAAHTNTSQLLYIIAEKGKNNKKVTTIKESASVYSGKNQKNILPYQMPFKKIEKKPKQKKFVVISNQTFYLENSHKRVLCTLRWDAFETGFGKQSQGRSRKNGHFLHVDCG